MNRNLYASQPDAHLNQVEVGDSVEFEAQDKNGWPVMGNGTVIKVTRRTADVTATWGDTYRHISHDDIFVLGKAG